VLFIIFLAFDYWMFKFFRRSPTPQNEQCIYLYYCLGYL